MKYLKLTMVLALALLSCMPAHAFKSYSNKDILRECIDNINNVYRLTDAETECLYTGSTVIDPPYYDHMQYTPDKDALKIFNQRGSWELMNEGEKHRAEVAIGNNFGIERVGDFPDRETLQQWQKLIVIQALFAVEQHSLNNRRNAYKCLTQRINSTRAYQHSFLSAAQFDDPFCAQVENEQIQRWQILWHYYKEPENQKIRYHIYTNEVSARTLVNVDKQAVNFLFKRAPCVAKATINSVVYSIAEINNELAAIDANKTAHLECLTEEEREGL